MARLGGVSRWYTRSACTSHQLILISSALPRANITHTTLAFSRPSFQLADLHHCACSQPPPSYRTSPKLAHPFLFLIFYLCAVFCGRQHLFLHVAHIPSVLCALSSTDHLSRRRVLLRLYFFSSLSSIRRRH